MNETNITEQMAIISNVGIGNRDVGHPVLWFELKREGMGALQVFNWDMAAEILKEADVYDIKDLEGRACIVEREGNYMRFKRIAKI